MQYKGAIFDMDGLLFDTELIFRKIFYCVVFGGRATASLLSNALYKAILNFAKNVGN